MLKENLELGNIGLKLKLFNPYFFGRRFMAGDWQPCPRAFAPPFLSSLCGPKERWSKPPYWPLIPEHPPGGSYLQNGANFGDCLWNCPPHVGLHGGPQICLLPCNHGMGIPRVPCICGGRADLCLPGYAVRPFSGPLGFLQEHQTYQIPSPYFTVPFHTYLDDFSLPHPGSLWLFRLHTSFLFSNNLVSGYTSPSHNLLCPRWSSTWVVLHLDTLQITLPESKVSRILSTCRGTICSSMFPVPGGYPQFRLLSHTSGQVETETHHQLDERRHFNWPGMSP